MKCHLLMVAPLLYGLSACSGNQGSSATTWQSHQSTTVYTPLALNSDDTVNPLRGYYRWSGQELVPQAAPALDAYQRYLWKDLEPAADNYDFSRLHQDLQTARQSGRKFAFRLRMMRGYDDGLRYLPDYLVGNPLCQNGCGWWADYSSSTPGLTFIPDWNDPYLQQRGRALLQALANTLSAEEKASIAWIDVGLYGQYGEWALSSAIDYATAPNGISPITEASKRAWIDLQLQAFPEQQWVMFALYGNLAALRYALGEQTLTTRPVGLRIDCLGRVGFMNQWLNHPSEWAEFSNQWQRAPFVAEFCGPFSSGDANNNASTALQQVRDFHISTVGNGNLAAWDSFTADDQQLLRQIGREAGYRYRLTQADIQLDGNGMLNLAVAVENAGAAPTYDPWQLTLELRDTTDQIVWQQAVPADLRQLASVGASQRLTGQWPLPSLAAGDYSLWLIARDPATLSPRPPLRWHQQEQEATHGARLATLHRN